MPSPCTISTLQTMNAARGRSPASTLARTSLSPRCPADRLPETLATTQQCLAEHLGIWSRPKEELPSRGDSPAPDAAPGVAQGTLPGRQCFHCKKTVKTLRDCSSCSSSFCRYHGFWCNTSCCDVAACDHCQHGGEEHVRFTGLTWKCKRHWEL